MSSHRSQKLMLCLRLMIAVLCTYLGTTLSACDDSIPQRLPSVRQCAISIRYQAQHIPSQILVHTGDQSAPLSLLDPQIDPAGLWGADLWLKSGWQSYYLEVDGRRLLDPKQALSIKTGALEESLVFVPNCQQGRWFMVSKQGQGKAQTFNLAFERGLSKALQALAEQGEQVMGVPLDKSSVKVQIDDQDYPSQLEGELLSFNTQNLEFGKHWLRISAFDQEAQEAEVFHAPFWVEPQKHRWTQGLMYQIVLDRLSPPMPVDHQSPSIAERWGGQIDQVTELLESGYLERLGVKTLWLSPLAPNPTGLWEGVEGGAKRYSSYHGYWASEARKLGPEWGSEQALKDLVKLAHQKGMRIIVDVALNHVHESHPYVQEHPDWFYPPGCLCGRPGCDWGRYIESCRFTEYLPDIRWEGREAMQQQVADALWWIENYDLDGLRVDAVPMMPRRVTRLLSTESQRRFEGLGSRHLLIGETFTGPQEWSRIAWYLGPKGLDGQFNFPFMWGLRETIAWESTPMWSLVELWKSGESYWSNSASLMGSFIGNHDVTRFFSEAAQHNLSDPWNLPPEQSEEESALGRLWIATALSFTLPGIPVLYYGDEVGLAGANDPDNRRPFWPLSLDAPNQLSTIRQQHFEKVAQLGRIRACYPAFSTEESQVIFLANDEESLSFIRGGTGQEMIIIVQRQASASRVLQLPSQLTQAEKTWVNLLTDEQITLRLDNDPQTQQKKAYLLIPEVDRYSVQVLIRQSQQLQCLR